MDKIAIKADENLQKKPYIGQFLSLKCAGDVLNVVNPIGKKATKEISESMAIMKHLRKIVLKEPMKYFLYDFCAGNAITSVIASHLLPITGAMAIDNRPRKREWHLCKKFLYRTINLYEYPIKSISTNSIIIAVHPCKNLAKEIINIYLKSNASHLIMMPCCNGPISLIANQEIKKTIDPYHLWCLELTFLCNGNMRIDNGAITPKNVIITASK